MKLENENQWNLCWARPPNSDAEWTQWTAMLHQLNKVKFKSGEDKWKWKTSDKGEFTVAAIRNQIARQDRAGSEEEWKYWNMWVPPKVNYFTWRASIERIPAKKELIKRRIPINNHLCSRCEAYEETADHVICGYSLSKSIWRNIVVWLKLPRSTEFRECRDTLEYVNDLPGSKEWKRVINAVFQTTMWNIWKARNEKEFEGNTRSGNSIVESTMADSFIWLKSRSKFQDIVWERWVDFNMRDIVK
ncbi:uncharacterized protein LOC110913594 [Helianthus annuus]|uniref:uncharacterized protein LOC110913594 n=1 Tax=Helianthus annuus TaxID=4232 RepID=UPI000B9041D5|nr:uncharacterized protein LOC110913594 [Helianthus annuus]